MLSVRGDYFLSSLQLMRPHTCVACVALRCTFAAIQSALVRQRTTRVGTQSMSSPRLTHSAPVRNGVCIQASLAGKELAGIYHRRIAMPDSETHKENMLRGASDLQIYPDFTGRALSRQRHLPLKAIGPSTIAHEILAASPRRPTARPHRPTAGLPAPSRAEKMRST